MSKTDQAKSSSNALRKAIRAVNAALKEHGTDEHGRGLAAEVAENHGEAFQWIADKVRAGTWKTDQSSKDDSAPEPARQPIYIFQQVTHCGEKQFWLCKVTHFESQAVEYSIARTAKGNVLEYLGRVPKSVAVEKFKDFCAERKAEAEATTETEAVSETEEVAAAAA